MVCPDGSQFWYWRGQRHRDFDLPAIVHANGMRAWWQHGKQHRGGGQPAVTHASGQLEWWVNGLRHRNDNDQPALMDPASNRREWHLDGKLHRDNDQPAVVIDGANWARMWFVHGARSRGVAAAGQDLPTGERADGWREWRVNDMLHRDGDLPAYIESCGSLTWFQNGRLHRDNGKPARMNSSGVQVWAVGGVTTACCLVADFSTGGMRFAFVKAVAAASVQQVDGSAAAQSPLLAHLVACSQHAFPCVDHHVVGEYALMVAWFL